MPPINDDLEGTRIMVKLDDLLYARRQAGEARRSEIMARSEAARALLKLEIDSHSLWVVHDEDGG